MRIEDDGQYFLESIEYSGSLYNGKCVLKKANENTRVVLNVNFNLLMDSRIKELEDQNAELKERIDKVVK